eukprot:GILI01013812.1.p1 GENE.GILI01013812.1~~GILI01013812.1.p1  ORF type:complete len:823 (+),score=188.48 GILI01013812.1:184-2469(+)
MSMLRQVFTEGLSMVLVLNKVDLLITTMQLTAEEAYIRMRTVIESCNATLASFTNQLEIAGERSDLLKDVPEDNVWFSPSKGNVVFCSCLDGWGFGLDHFAPIYTKKLGVTVTKDDLWGNKFFDMKNKTISTTPKRDDHPPIAIQMILNPMWQLHQTFLADDFDEAACITMSEKLGIDPKVWNKPKHSARVKLSALLKHWMPLATSVLNMICEHSSSPIESQQRRLPRLIAEFDSLPEDLKEALNSCNPSDEVPAVAFISKLLDTESMAGQTIGAGSGKQLEDNFVGFARVYSGKIRKGQRIKVQTVNGHSETIVEKVYLLRGRGLEEVDAMSAGCLCGIGGITSHITKHATVSTDDRMPPMIPPRLSSTSIVRLSVAPVNPSELPQLVKGLQFLYKVDPQVEIFVLPTGEHVIGGAGEVHAERCVKDLRDTFACIEMVVSEPLVPFRESIIPNMGKPKVAIQSTPFGHLTFTIYAKALPEECLSLIRDESTNVPSDEFATKLVKLIGASDEKKKWQDVGELWGWGPKKLGYCGALLFSAFSSDDELTNLMVSQYRDAITSGFELAAVAGPMADEPMMGIAFVITDISYNPEAPESASASLTGQVMSAVKDACRKAFENNGRRLVEPMYDCTVYSSGQTQGKLYALLSKRRAIIVDEVLNEGSDLFYIKALLPANASFGLQDELRIATSGAAAAQLRMSHWAAIEQDPYYKPTTKEELEEDGTTVQQNFAAQTLEKIRKRKGLHREVLVEAAEKQKFSVKN